MSQLGSYADFTFTLQYISQWLVGLLLGTGKKTRSFYLGHCNNPTSHCETRLVKDFFSFPKVSDEQIHFHEAAGW